MSDIRDNEDQVPFRELVALQDERKGTRSPYTAPDFDGQQEDFAEDEEVENDDS